MADARIAAAGKVGLRPVEVVTGGLKAGLLVSVVLGGLSLVLAQVFDTASAQFFGGRFGTVDRSDVVLRVVLSGWALVGLVTAARLVAALGRRSTVAALEADRTGPVIGAGHMTWRRPEPVEVQAPADPGVPA